MAGRGQVPADVTGNGRGGIEPHDEARAATGDGSGGADGSVEAHGDTVHQAGRPSVAIRSLREMSSGVRAEPVRYDLVARGLGAWGEFVDHPDQLGPALERARDAGRLAVIHVSVDRVEHTWTPEAGMFREQRAPRPLQI